jgi:hypothetical protein
MSASSENAPGPDESDASAQPPGWLYGLAGGLSGAGSALLFERALWIGVGTGAGVILFFAIYMSGR